MSETLTVPLEDNTSRGPEWLREARFDRVVRVRPSEAAHTLRLAQALDAFERARSWEESQAARQQILAIGPEVQPSVLEALSKAQPPSRFDVLEELLLRITSLDDLIELALAESAPVDLRASLATALGHADGDSAAGPEARVRLLGALLHLARDAHAGVRVAAVEAIGLAGLREARAELERIAAGDDSPTVRREAKATADELS
jgi:hypothetical protein